MRNTSGEQKNEAACPLAFLARFELFEKSLAFLYCRQTELNLLNFFLTSRVILSLMTMYVNDL